MSNNNVIKLKGKIVECLPGTVFKIVLENKKIVMGHLSGRMRINSIRLLVGDEVEIEVTPYDLIKGRIVSRLTKAERPVV